MNRFIKIVLSLALVGGALTLLFFSTRDAGQLYKHVDEVLKDPQALMGRSLQVHGFVEAGSITEEIRDQNIHRTFILEYEGARIFVTNSGPKPDTFRDLSEVVARGSLVKTSSGEYQLTAVELMAKCPSKYEENKRSRKAKPMENSISLR